MIFKKRTFFGDEPQRLPAEDPAELERRVAHCLAVAPGLDAVAVTVTGSGTTILLGGYCGDRRRDRPRRRGGPIC